LRARRLQTAEADGHRAGIHADTQRLAQPIAESGALRVA
jgi:hypothetical protein